MQSFKDFANICSFLAAMDILRYGKIGVSVNFSISLVVDFYYYFAYILQIFMTRCTKIDIISLYDYVFLDNLKRNIIYVDMFTLTYSFV